MNTPSQRIACIDKKVHWCRESRANRCTTLARTMGVSVASVLGKFKKALLACSAVGVLSAVFAENNWLTLVGDPVDPTSDYVQFDPSAIKRDNDWRFIPIRVSGKQPRNTVDGIAFKSITGLAAIDCKRKIARLLHAALYAEPDFKGTPFITRELGPEIGPGTFRGMDGERAQQIVKAACKDVASN